MCVLKLEYQVTKLDQDAKKSFRFEINGTSAAEDLENFRRYVFRTQSVLYFSSVIVNRNMSTGSFKKPEDLTTHNNNQYSI